MYAFTVLRLVAPRLKSLLPSYRKKLCPAGQSLIFSSHSGLAEGQETSKFPNVSISYRTVFVKKKHFMIRFADADTRVFISVTPIRFPRIPPLHPSQHSLLLHYFAVLTAINRYKKTSFFRMTFFIALAVILAGVAGFEPTSAGVKVPCLTAWRYPTAGDKKWGERWGSNPRHPEPQSGALPLNYVHHIWRAWRDSNPRPSA